MKSTPPIITLLTDFGENGSYVGAMKGVILGIVPGVQLIDITHQVAPQDIQQAAAILAGVYRYYPARTVHVVVVDPGVGGVRRKIALETPQGRFVAPDNGVLTYIQRQQETWQAVSLDNPDYWLPHPSHTFHGRDIFSPAAAHLASGVPLERLGSPCQEIVTFALPELEIGAGQIRGEVVRPDRFGNLLTNVAPLHWVDDRTVEFRPEGGAPLRFDASRVRVTFSWHTLNGLHQTYSQVPPGQALALIGSSGELELAVNQGSAHDKLAVKAGDTVTLFFEG